MKLVVFITSFFSFFLMEKAEACQIGNGNYRMYKNSRGFRPAQIGMFTKALGRFKHRYRCVKASNNRILIQHGGPSGMKFESWVPRVAFENIKFQGPDYDMSFEDFFYECDGTPTRKIYNSMLSNDCTGMSIDILSIKWRYCTINNYSAYF